jgi:alkylhydroperoxidase family enzyme
MLRWLIRKKLASEEKKLGVSLEYARHILRVSLRAFFKFLKVIPLANYYRKLPPGPYYVAQLVATRDEDCGECVQIVVNQARRAGVPATILQAALAEKVEELPADHADAYRFAEAVVRRSGAEEELRERIRHHFGEDGLVELALGIAACRVFPVTKRALGYSTSCALVRVAVE